MKFIWHGHSCFSVDSNGYSAVFDPYGDGSVPGYAPLRLSADAVFCSHGHADHSAKELVTLSDREFPYRVDALACYHDDKRGLLRGKNTIHILEAEGMRIAHLGDLGHMPKGKTLEALKGLDAVMIPVGGFYTIDAKTAHALIETIEPRVVFPMHYRWEDKAYDVISELTPFTELCDNVIAYDSDTFELTATTPAQTAVLRYCHG